MLLFVVYEFASSNQRVPRDFFLKPLSSYYTKIALWKECILYIYMPYVMHGNYIITVIVYIYICIYIYVGVCVYMYIYAYVFVYMYIRQILLYILLSDVISTVNTGRSRRICYPFHAVCHYITVAGLTEWGLTKLVPVSSNVKRFWMQYATGLSLNRPLPCRRHSFAW